MSRFAALLLGALAGVALAAEGPTVLSEREWERRLDELWKPAVTKLERAEKLRDISKGCVVETAVKIVEVEPEKEGARVHVCRRFGGEWRECFFVGDPATVRDWKRWDRLTLRWALEVEEDRVEGFRLVTTKPAEMRRAPDPGVEFPDPARTVENFDRYREWLASYAKASASEDWPLAWRSYQTGCATLWEVSAEVESADDNRVHMKIPGNVALIDKRTERRWGVVGARHDVVVEDPQLLEALTPGRKVVLALDVTGVESWTKLRDTEGALPLAFTVRRLP